MPFDCVVYLTAMLFLGQHWQVLNSRLTQGYELIYADTNATFVHKDNATKEDYDELIAIVSKNTDMSMSLQTQELQQKKDWLNTINLTVRWVDWVLSVITIVHDKLS